MLLYIFLFFFLKFNKKADNDPTIYIKGIKLYILPNADKFDDNTFVYRCIY